MTIEAQNSIKLKTNCALDVAKLIMAILVIGIHTEPFGFNFWLDKGFGIVTRLCVPFFFVTSAYFFWQKEKSPKTVLQRIIILYLAWSIIYLPFDISELGQMTVPKIFRRFIWDGNEHALWYLCGTIIGFCITSILLKFFEPKYILIIAIVFLSVGTIKSTYHTAVNQLIGINLPDYLGSRNGLFYAFPYIALGMTIAKTDAKGIFKSKKRLYVGFIVSFLLLLLESFLFVIHFKTDSTILWMSVFPYTYFFFEIVLNTKIQLRKDLSLKIRKTSTLMYLSQFIFIPAIGKFSSNISLFILAVIATTLFSLIIIKMSEKKHFSFLQYLY